MCLDVKMRLREDGSEDDQGEEPRSPDSTKKPLTVLYMFFFPANSRAIFFSADSSLLWMYFNFGVDGNCDPWFAYLFSLIL